MSKQERWWEVTWHLRVNILSLWQHFCSHWVNLYDIYNMIKHKLSNDMLMICKWDVSWWQDKNRKQMIYTSSTWWPWGIYISRLNYSSVWLSLTACISWRWWPSNQCQTSGNLRTSSRMVRERLRSNTILSTEVLKPTFSYNRNLKKT